MRTNDDEDRPNKADGEPEEQIGHCDHSDVPEEQCSSEGETELKQPEANQVQPLGDKGSRNPGRRINTGLSSLIWPDIQAKIRLFDLLQTGPAESVLRSLVRPSLFDPLRLTNAFPPLFSGINQRLAKSFDALDLLPPSLTSGLFPRVSLGILDGLLSPFDQILRPFPAFVHPKAGLAKELGWVVHHTLPLTLLDNANEDDLDEAIMTYYRENWFDVRKKIELDTGQSIVDLDSREIMIQALEAHESGLYRLVSRSLLTEIERTIRVQLRGKLVEKGVNIKETILNEVDDLPSAAFHDLTSGISQFDTLENHLYENIRDENDRSQFEESHIPNRHAAIHGLVPYSSEKSSLNSIFITDFVFHIITQVKKERIKAAAEILTGYILSVESDEQETRPQ